MQWRYLALISLFTFELHTITSPTFPTFLTNILNPFLTFTHLRPPYLPFQAITLLRKLILTIFIALSQLGPLFPAPAASTTTTINEIHPQQMQRLANITAALQKEAGMLMQLEMTPLEGSEENLRDLKNKMRRFLVDNTVRSDGGVKSAIGRVLERRREGVPHGAIGTR